MVLTPDSYIEAHVYNDLIKRSVNVINLIKISKSFKYETLSNACLAQIIFEVIDQN